MRHKAVTRSDAVYRPTTEPNTTRAQSQKMRSLKAHSSASYLSYDNRVICKPSRPSLYLRVIAVPRRCASAIRGWARNHTSFDRRHNFAPRCVRAIHARRAIEQWTKKIGRGVAFTDAQLTRIAMDIHTAESLGLDRVVHRLHGAREQCWRTQPGSASISESAPVMQVSIP